MMMSDRDMDMGVWLAEKRGLPNIPVCPIKMPLSPPIIQHNSESRNSPRVREANGESHGTHPVPNAVRPGGLLNH